MASITGLSKRDSGRTYTFIYELDVFEGGMSLGSNMGWTKVGTSIDGIQPSQPNVESLSPYTDTDLAEGQCQRT